LKDGHTPFDILECVNNSGKSAGACFTIPWVSRCPVPLSDQGGIWQLPPNAACGLRHFACCPVRGPPGRWSAAASPLTCMVETLHTEYLTQNFRRWHSLLGYP
jgi:hypothetical protein